MERDEDVGLNRRKAIRLKCLDCSGYEYKEVRNCPYTGCSLYPFRSGKGTQNPTDRDKAIREYCMWCTLDQPKEILLCPSGACPLHEFRGYIRVKKMPIVCEKTSSRGIQDKKLDQVIPEHMEYSNQLTKGCI